MLKRTFFAVLVFAMFLAAGSLASAAGDGKCNFDSDCAGHGKCSSGRCK
jgi:hypothetical protein